MTNSVQYLKSFIVHLLVVLWSLSTFQVGAQSEFEDLKKRIKLSSYYDSLELFNLGEQAILQARKHRSKSEEAQILQIYGDYYYHSWRRNKAVEFYRKSIALAQQDADSHVVHANRMRLAHNIADNGDQKEALKNFEELLLVVSTSKDWENTVDCYNGIGLMQERLGDYKAALTAYLDGYKVAESHQLKYHQGVILNNLGLLRSRYGESEQALKDFTSGLEFAELTRSYRLAIHLGINLGLIHLDKKDYEKALSHYKETLGNAYLLGYPFEIGAAYINLCSVHHRLKNYDQGIACADSAYAILSASKSKWLISKAIVGKALIYLDQKKYALAESEFAIGLKYAQAEKQLEDEVEVQSLMSRLYEETHRYDEALKALRIHQELKDSLSEMRNQEVIKELEIKYDVEKKEKELLEETNRAEILKQENLVKETKMKIILISAILSILLVLATVYIRYIRVTRRQQQEFSANLIKQIEEERGRIAKDLHDDIGQSLSMIKSRVHLYSTGQTNNLEGVEQQLGETIEHTRSISRNLFPSSLAKIGLTRSVASLLETTEKSVGVVTSYEIDPQVENRGIEVSTHLYRIIQECVNNTIKHAEAKAIKVSIDSKGDGFLLTYQDNGKGFGNHASGNGIGMMSIRERVRIIGGDMGLGDNDGKGFKMVVRF